MIFLKFIFVHGLDSLFSTQVPPHNLEEAAADESSSGAAEEDVPKPRPRPRPPPRRQDAPMRWEFYILKSSRWAPYDPYNDDKIEEAYQQYQVDDSRQNREIEITVNKKYTYTINFEHMNSTSHGPNKDRTDIRRVAGAVLMTQGRVAGCWYQQTWIGSFSAVSKPNFASKY